MRSCSRRTRKSGSARASGPPCPNMSSRSNMSAGTYGRGRRAQGRSVRQSLILLNYLQTGAQRLNERQCGRRATLSGRRSRPRYTSAVTACHRIKRDPADGDRRTHTRPAEPAEPPRRRVGERRCASSRSRARFTGARAPRRRPANSPRSCSGAGSSRTSTPPSSPAATCTAPRPSDVARVEHLTYICTRSQEDAGPNNHWMEPQARRTPRCASCSAAACASARCTSSRTAWGRSIRRCARCGVEITDSPYVVLNMLIMTRAGRAALERIAREGSFVRGLHSIGRARPGAALHHALPRGTRDRELRFGLRRQRAARQEVPRAAHRELAGAQRGLARRAHADRRPAESARRDALRRLRLPVRLRQDESGHADSAGLAARLESVHGGR